MLTFVTGLVIKGPVNSIQSDLQEIVRSFTCMFEEIKGASERFSSQFEKLIISMKDDNMSPMINLIKQYKEEIRQLADNAVADQARKLKRIEEDWKPRDKRSQMQQSQYQMLSTPQETS